MIRPCFSLARALALAASASCVLAQAAAPRPASGRATIDQTKAVTLAGNVFPLARPEFDQGLVNSETRMDRMLLLLKPSARQQAALDALVAAQQDPALAVLSPLAHSGGVRSPFWRQLWRSGPHHPLAHQPRVCGERSCPGHHGLLSSPARRARWPTPFTPRCAATASAARCTSPTPRTRRFPRRWPGWSTAWCRSTTFATPRRCARTGRWARGRSGISTGSHYLFPADFAAIYNLNPVYSAGATGSGVSIAIAGRSNIHLGDVAAFRAASGLAANTPSVVLPDADPGLVNGDQDESTLDVEWAGAVAPAAAVTLVAGASTASTDGVDLAAAYIVNHALAQVVSTQLRQLRTGHGRHRAGLLQQPLGAGCQPGHELLCGLGRLRRGRLRPGAQPPPAA